MARWHTVARLDAIDGEGPHHVSAEGTDAVLVRVDGELRAFEGLCPHQGALLGEGELIDGQLVCRNHRWCFDAETGERDGGPECLQRYPLREVDGRVELDLGAVEAGAASQPARRFEDLDGPSTWSVLKSAFAPGAIESIHHWWEEQVWEYGNTYAYKAAGLRIIGTCELEPITATLRQRPDTFSRSTLTRPAFESVDTVGVFAEEGDPWRAQRRLAVRALNGRTLKSFFPTLVEMTERLRKRWAAAADEGRVLDIQDELMRYTVDVTTSLTFGVETNLIEGDDSWLLEQLDGVFDLLGRRVAAIFPIYKVYRSRSDRRVEGKIDTLRGWVAELVEERLPKLEERDDEVAQSFLDAMLTAQDTDGAAFDSRVIFGNAMTMLLAGEDTTANSLAWVTHLMMDSEQERRAAQAAADDILGPALIPDSQETVKQLTAFENIANEALRMKNPAPALGHCALRDTTVGDISMREGDNILLLTRLASMHPDHIDDPETFSPGRWDDAATASELQRSGAFVPFGSGPRMCPGRSLALLEMKMVLSMLFRNFELERVGRSEDVEEVFGFVMLPRGIQLRLHHR